MTQLLLLVAPRPAVVAESSAKAGWIKRWLPHSRSTAALLASPAKVNSTFVPSLVPDFALSHCRRSLFLSRITDISQATFRIFPQSNRPILESSSDDNLPDRTWLFFVLRDVILDFWIWSRLGRLYWFKKNRHRNFYSAFTPLGPVRPRQEPANRLFRLAFFVLWSLLSTFSQTYLDPVD